MFGPNEKEREGTFGQNDEYWQYIASYQEMVSLCMS